MTSTPASRERSLADQFAVFRREHPPITFEHEGTGWTYTAAGQGGQGVMLLPGAAGGGEAYFRLVPDLENDFRLVMIDYPVVDDLDSLLRGLMAILVREGIERTAVVGGSFGGMVAQAFLLTNPERTTRVVLSGTLPPSEERARANLKWQRVMRLIPMPAIRGLLRLVIRKMVKAVAIEGAFWKDYYLSAANSLTRNDLESRYRAEIPFDESFGEKLDKLGDWSGEILILKGSADSMTKKVRETTLQEAYPKARMHVFPGAGHGASLERPEEWHSIVCEFLLGYPEPVDIITTASA